MLVWRSFQFFVRSLSKETCALILERERGRGRIRSNFRGRERGFLTARGHVSLSPRRPFLLSARSLLRSRTFRPPSPLCRHADRRGSKRPIRPATLLSKGGRPAPFFPSPRSFYFPPRCSLGISSPRSTENGGELLLSRPLRVVEIRRPLVLYSFDWLEIECSVEYEETRSWKCTISR